jgi:hypothetical protein
MTRSFFRAWMDKGRITRRWLQPKKMLNWFFFQRRKATVPVVAAVMRAAHLEDPGRAGAAGGGPRRASRGRGRRRSRAGPGLIAVELEVAAAGEQAWTPHPSGAQRWRSMASLWSGQVAGESVPEIDAAGRPSRSRASARQFGQSGPPWRRVRGRAGGWRGGGRWWGKEREAAMGGWKS